MKRKLLVVAILAIVVLSIATIVTVAEATVGNDAYPCGVVTFTTPTEVIVAPGGSVRIAGSYSGTDWLVGSLSWNGGDAVANPFDSNVTPPAVEGTYTVFLGSENMSCPRYTVTIKVETPVPPVPVDAGGDTTTPSPSTAAKQTNAAATAATQSPVALPTQMPYTGWEMIPMSLIGTGLVGTGGYLLSKSGKSGRKK